MFNKHCNNILNETARAVLPTKCERDNRGRIANQIKKILEARSQYRISQTKIAGSYGKKTSIISSDIDIVIFIKGVNPPFEHVINEFESILKSIVGITHLKYTTYSLQFNVDNYEFDLLPAADLVPNQNIGAHVRIRDQQRRTLKKMVRKSNRKVYSSSLAFSTIDFMKRQSSLAKEIVRLAKFWYKSACITEYISGAKYAMELIAVDATNHVDEEARSKCPYFAAFLHFLKTVRDWDSMDIVFDYTFDNIRRQHWPAKNVSYVRLIDPANPYNNLQNNFSDDVVKKLRDHADETLTQLKGNYPSAEFRFIVDIFHPGLFDVVHERCMHTWITDNGRTKLKSSVTYKNVTIRELRRCINDFERRQMEFMYIYLKGLCQQLCDSDDYDWYKYDDPLDEFISKLLDNLDEQQDISDFEDEYVCDDFDVSLWLDGPKGKFRLSFDLADDSDSESGSETETESDSDSDSN